MGKEGKQKNFNDFGRGRLTEEFFLSVDLTDYFSGLVVFVFFNIILKIMIFTTSTRLK